MDGDCKMFQCASNQAHPTANRTSITPRKTRARNCRNGGIWTWEADRARPEYECALLTPTILDSVANGVRAAQHEARSKGLPAVKSIVAESDALSSLFFGK